MKLVFVLFITIIFAGLKDCQNIDEDKYISFHRKRVQYANPNPDPDGKELAIECHNVTMDFRDGKVHLTFFNGTHNGTDPVGGARIVTLCRPTEKEEYSKLRGLGKPFCFAVLAFVFQMQVPLMACLNRGFRRIGSSLIVAYILCLASAYYILPTDMWLKDTPAFSNFWFTTPCVLNYISLSTLGWMNLLTCDLVVCFLISMNQAVITEKNGLVLKRFSGILNLSFLVGIAIAVFTFVTIHSRMIENVTGLPDETGSTGRMLPYFFPTVLILSIVNVLFYVIGRVCSANDLSSHGWSRMGAKNAIYFGLLVFVVISWIFGCIIVIKDLWNAWHTFSLVSVIIPGLTLRAINFPEEFEEPIPDLLHSGGEKIAFDITDDKMTLLAIKVEPPEK